MDLLRLNSSSPHLPRLHTLSPGIATQPLGPDCQVILDGAMLTCVVADFLYTSNGILQIGTANFAAPSYSG
jgi:hypothetical protein